MNQTLSGKPGAVQISGFARRRIARHREKKRERFLTDEEFHRLGQMLNEIEAECPETLSAVTAIRLLMLTAVS